MKAVSWNIDGLNSALENKSARGKLSYNILKELASMDLDIIAIQETKLSSPIVISEVSKSKVFDSYPAEHFPLNDKHSKLIKELFPGYHVSYSVSLAKRGYSGTLTLHKAAALTSTSPQMKDYLPEGNYGIESESIEGRVTTTEFEDFFFVNVYTPNSGSRGQEPRQLWDIAFRNYLSSLKGVKPVIACGDFNVAHEEIDLKNPKGNHDRPGFTPSERTAFDKLLKVGFTDTFRHVNGAVPQVYSWWTQLSKTAKTNNSGWRIDYFLVSDNLKERVVASYMIDSGERKDHTPIFFEMK